MQAKSHLRPSSLGILKRDRPVILIVRGEVCNGVRHWPLLRITCLVGQEHSQQASGALHPHPDVK